MRSIGDNPLKVWSSSEVTLSGPGLFFAGRFFIAVLISAIFISV
jgi:hypothetical protein